jgi:hypothetical protein
MKKILGIIFVGLFILSIVGSVSPTIKSEIIHIAGGKKYASTQLPTPNAIESNKNLADKLD